MPVIYAVGQQKIFRNAEEGLKAGFYMSYSELAQAKAREAWGEPEKAPKAKKAAKPAPVATEAPEAVESEPAKLTNAEIKAAATEAGIPTEGVHHETLRKEVEGYLLSQ